VSEAPERARPFVGADEVNEACWRAGRVLRERTGRQTGGKGETPERDEHFGPDGWVRVGTLWTMDDPGLQWAVWLNLNTNRGIARRETFDAAIRDAAYQ